MQNGVSSMYGVAQNARFGVAAVVYSMSEKKSI
jgi:hypothetical protein